MNAETWNRLPLSQKELVCFYSCGWARRTANRIAKTPYDKLTQAAKTVIERYDSNFMVSD